MSINQIKVDVIDEEGLLAGKITYDFVENVLGKAAELEEINRCELSVTLVNNEQIRELNKEYRGIDKETDVLSFPLEDEESEEMIFLPEEDEEFADYLSSLGDIVISIPKTIEQAEEFGHSLERELAFLLVHGFLHLLGFDHETEDEEREMFAKQDEILNALNLSR
jgi:probable rRNA maturation factor